MWSKQAKSRAEHCKRCFDLDFTFSSILLGTLVITSRNGKGPIGRQTSSRTTVTIHSEANPVLCSIYVSITLHTTKAHVCKDGTTSTEHVVPNSIQLALGSTQTSIESGCFEARHLVANPFLTTRRPLTAVGYNPVDG